MPWLVCYPGKCANLVGVLDLLVLLPVLVRYPYKNVKLGLGTFRPRTKRPGGHFVPGRNVHLEVCYDGGSWVFIGWTFCPGGVFRGWTFCPGIRGRTFCPGI